MKKYNIALFFLILFLISMITATTYFASDTYYVDGDWKFSASNANRSEYGVAEYLGNGTRVDIPAIFLGKPVVKVDDNAFLNHPYLQYCEFPVTITEIGESAFYRCIQLKQVVIPLNVEKIGDYAFYGCSSLVMLQIESNPSLKVIPEQAFNYCTSLTMVNLSNGVEKIEAYAFNDCSMLSTMIIPPSVSSISENAFEGCISLSIYGWEGTYAQEYAKANSIKFVSMGEYREPTAPPVITTAPIEDNTTEEIVVTTATDPIESIVTSVSTESSETIISSVTTIPVSSNTETTSEEKLPSDPMESTSSTNITSSSVIESTSVSVSTSEIDETTSKSEFTKYFIGDADIDGRVTIKDATVIQKYAAKIVSFNHIQKFLANADSTGGITVKDATQIQKYLAGYNAILFVGTEVWL